MTKHIPKRRPAPGRSKDEVKHEVILKAATRLFLRHGYTNTSMDAIAEAASVTKQTVYSHYQNKELLFTMMVSSLCDRHGPLVVQVDEPVQSLESLLCKISGVLLDMMTSKEALAATRLVIAEAHEYPKLAQRYYEASTQRLITMLAQFLEEQHKRGALPAADMSSAAACFIALLKDQYYLRMILALKPQPSKETREMHVRETVRRFLRIYGMPESH